MSDAHAAGHGRISLYSAVCGQRTSLREGFFRKNSAPFIRTVRCFYVNFLVFLPPVITGGLSS